MHLYRLGPSDTFFSRRRDAQSDNGTLECLVRFAPFANSSATDLSGFVHSRATTEPPSATDEEQQLSSLLVEAISPSIRLVIFLNCLNFKFYSRLVSFFTFLFLTTRNCTLGMLPTQCNIIVREYIGG